MSTPTVRLATLILGEPLEGWVRQRRNAGQPWDGIAGDLAEATEKQVKISGEYLRQLYRDPKPNDGEDAA